nr:family 78 glycoside hydrolase catalytic domain [uncultured Draconibacterium sp.]
MKNIESKKLNATTFVLLSILMVAIISSCNSHVQTVDLRCEYRVNPLGIDNVNPRLSWKISDDQQTRGQKQTAYQVLVASSEEELNKNIGDLWDSGKQMSNQSVNVACVGAALTSNQECYWKVRIWDMNGKVSDWSKPALFSIGLLNPEDWKGEWIYKEDQSKKDHNWYRKNFTLQDNPDKAMVYVASFGYHEIYVNGHKVTEGVMNPVYSFMKKRLPYLTYNIKPYLQKGDNVIGIWHAAGWARWGRIKEYYDPPFVFKAQADIRFADQNLLLVTDTSWKCKKSHSAYVGRWDILGFGGEIIDERLREDDWNTAEYNDLEWDNAVVFDQSQAQEVGIADITLGPKGAVLVPGTDDNPPSSKITATLSAQMVEPQVKFKEIKPIGVKKNEEGTYVIDMGENYTGFFEMNMYNGSEGDTVVFEIADQTGRKSSYKQKSMYVYDKTGTGHFTNRFNLAGGRWITISGIHYKPELKDAIGYVITNNRKQISSFESSSELLNKIYEINLRTYLANTIDGILVDCPHRERRGWGEVTVAAMYGDALPNFESGAYMQQYAQFMQDAQADDGKMRAVINGDDFYFLMWIANSPVTIWETYRMLGDERLLENHYDTMKKWMNWLFEHSDNATGGALKIGERGSLEFPGLGDWCTPRGNFWSASNSPESAHFNNCVYAYMLNCAQNIASVLNKKEDAALYANRLKVQQKATHEQSYDPATGKYGEGHQVNQAFALFAGVTPETEQERVYANLVDQVLYKFPYYDTGSSGQGLYTRFFTEYAERMDLIYELLQDTRHPSYGYFIREGKTVWPERWSATGGSQIHTCYTGIGGYFIKGFGGIRPNTERPGMQNFIVKPAPVGDLNYANTTYQSMFGDILVNWEKNDTTARYQIEIPVNTTAKVYLPAKEKRDVMESEIVADQVNGISYIGTEKSDAVGNYVIYELGSGVYDFTVNGMPETGYPDPLEKVENLALIGRMNASSMTIKSEKLPVFEAFRANDENLETAWKAKTSENEWLEVEWVKPQTFNQVVINETGNNIKSYTIEYWDGNGWNKLAEGVACGANKQHHFKSVISTKCRLNIQESNSLPAIAELMFFN